MLTVSAAASAAIVVLIAVFLVRESAMFGEGVGFPRITSDAVWSPMENSYGMVPVILGTVLTSAGALLWVVPCGVLSAIFMTFIAGGALRAAMRLLMGVLAGVPSVVLGFWGLVNLVPLINGWHAPGASVLAGIIVLGIMLLPTMTLAADAAIRAVAQDQLAAARALGVGFAGILRLAVLPSALPMLIAGVTLAAGRAVGETMALLMVTGNVVQIPHSVFDPVRTLAANIALEMAYAQGLHRSALFVSGLVLMGFVALLAVIGAAVRRREGDGSLAS